MTGKVTAVVQMLNKICNEDEGFSDEDEEIIRVCSVRVAEALDTQKTIHAQAVVDMEQLVREERRATIKVKQRRSSC